MQPPLHSDDWVGILDAELPVAAAGSWAVVARCGAVVSFAGHARDHSDGRPDVTELEYEAYESAAMTRLNELVADMRRRWPDLGRVVALHRVGTLSVTDAAVVVVVSAPHRDEAFDAARFGIDTLKSTLPVWKRERWAGGENWGMDSQPIQPVQPVQPHDEQTQPRVGDPR